MYAFDAYFRGNEVYINKKHPYLTNEILVQILNIDIGDLKNDRETLLRLLRKLKLESDMHYDAIEKYNENVQEAQRIMHRIDALIRAIPIYTDTFDASILNGDHLFDCLNECGWVWVDSDSIDDALEEDNEYGLYLYTGYDGDARHSFYNTYFKPVLDHSIEDADLLISLEEENASLEKLFNQYVTFIDDLLRVQNVYVGFIDNYLHAQNSFLNEQGIAKAYADFIKTAPCIGSKPYLSFSFGKAEMSHAILKDDSGQDILCEAYHFDSLGAFLYHDLFRGMKSNFIPKHCLNCNQYFLINAGKYSDYCENPLAEDSSKTCRDIGARKKYGDKCKNEPVWLTYNRAYKAHYARYMKKKMTVSEFEKWSAWAVEIRTQAENGEIEFSEYERQIKV